MKTSEFQHKEYLMAYPKGIEKHWWNVARNSVISRYASLHIPKDHKVLEVGCGTGIVTAHLQKKGWDIDGIDLGMPPQEALATDKLMLGKDALELPKEQQNTYNTIGLFDVIEHIENPSSFWQKFLANFRMLRMSSPPYPHVRSFGAIMMSTMGTKSGTVSDLQINSYRNQD